MSKCLCAKYFLAEDENFLESVLVTWKPGSSKITNIKPQIVVFYSLILV